jgi:hypothetical protein
MQQIALIRPAVARKIILNFIFYKYVAPPELYSIEQLLSLFQYCLVTISYNHLHPVIFLKQLQTCSAVFLQ